MRTKRPAQLDREIAEALVSSRRLRHHATIATAVGHVAAINHALYRSKDPAALIAAVRAAQKHVSAMKRVARKPPRHPGSSYFVSAGGEYDPKMYELVNLLVEAKKHAKNIRKQRRAR